ncbi:MAG: NAD(+)/NADH kinase [Intrasporangium sp.]|uniref:ATP-NAD kinase family protein n=1 Tax=Intrasporangium sp. TaxID=1925024 RepID=UPI002648FE93|nr:NAD(+)/NADH kinase [Intrasporangium sp.]MDN5796890.1 NAD(+)/NADH kinase [Intrasporangium sp.]
MAAPSLAIVANPMSGRDIRRLVAHASVFPNTEKASMVQRLVRAAGAVGVGRVLLSTDTMGVAREVRRRLDADRGRGGLVGADVEFVELDSYTGTAQDTTELVRRMASLGARVLVVLGGDGTVRAAAGSSDLVPLLPLSTGTNNAFPHVWEATVAGIAAGLVTVGALDAAEATYRAKALRVRSGQREEIALVDVCVASMAHVGAKAVWQPETLRELYCAFAEPHAIGLSSIAGIVHPVPRRSPGGVRVCLSPDAPRQVLAPLAPGLVSRVGVAGVVPLLIGAEHPVAVDRGTIAVDGEREIELGPGDLATVTLTADGPLILDVAAALGAAGELGRLDVPAGDAVTAVDGIRDI